MRKKFILPIVTGLSSLFLASFCELQAATLKIRIVDQKGEPVENAVVKAMPKSTPITLRKQNGVIDQINKEYVPMVVIVTKGSSVLFPNKDNIKHQVYSFSDAKKFELPLYEGTPAAPVTFEQAGVVVLGCNIHDWMRGYIYISDSQYTAMSDALGSTTLTYLPADTYEISLWHPQLSKMNEMLELTLSNETEKTIDLQINLKPLLKIRRTPANRRRNYN